MAKNKVDVIEVVRHGDKLIVPESVTDLRDAITAIQRQIEFEEEVVSIMETVNAFPWDGARALWLALKEVFGFAVARPTPGFFGDNPPRIISVETGVNQTENIIWGRFAVPGVDGTLSCGTDTDEHGRVVFMINAQVRRKDEAKIKKVAELTRKIVKEQSIYRAKAIRIRFRDDEGDLVSLPTPRFMDLQSTPEDLVFSDYLMERVRRNIWTVLERTETVRNAGVSTKRCILLPGPYGVGKTLLAEVTAGIATANGWGFVYLERAEDFREGFRFAETYGRTVLFIEDIDQVVRGERTVEMNDILNTLSGIDTRQSEVFVILTTNHIDEIHRAFLRQGRVDRIIPITPPDSSAAIELVRRYGRGLVQPSSNKDLAKVGAVLEGMIPAAIREVVESSKLAAITRAEGDEFHITPEDLLETAAEIKDHVRLLEEPPADRRGDLEKGLDVVGQRLAAAVTGGVRVARAQGVEAFDELVPVE